jgi:hypothetical protein
MVSLNYTSITPDTVHFRGTYDTNEVSGVLKMSNCH